MRRRALLLLLLPAVAAGCGEAETESTAGSAPTPDPALTKPGNVELPRVQPPKVREGSVPPGETGVLGVDGVAAVRPEELTIAKDAELSRITWNAWDADGAEGQANIRVLECRPTCAQGTPKDAGATIRLSEPKECPDGTYFDKAVVEIPGRDPMSFIQAPC